MIVLQHSEWVNTNMNINVKDLIKSNYTEPKFTVDFYQIVRPSYSTDDDSCTNKIIKTNSTICWKIQDNELIKIEDNLKGIFFDSETYIVQWNFDLKVDKTLIQETLMYYWKGQKAPKGFSPLPPEIEEHFPVERIVQWSEPALFFHAFKQSVVAFSGKEVDFNAQVPHLLLVRGELKEEIHLYEVPCEGGNLRSRAIFLLIVPEEKLVVYWFGRDTLLEYRNGIVEAIQPHKSLSKLCSEWGSFTVQTVVQGVKLAVFDDLVKPSVNVVENQTILPSPKLFYLNSITGDFLATEVEYPLRSSKSVAPFPFLQSHLYTATQPGTFYNHIQIILVTKNVIFSVISVGQPFKSLAMGRTSRC